MTAFKEFARRLRSALWLLVKNPYRRGMRGHIDGVYFGSLRGWAKADDGTPLTLLVKQNNVCIGQCKANGARADLAAQGLGDGRFGFALPLPPEVTIAQGDILEVVDAMRPSRSMAVKITPRMATRPAWRYPDQTIGALGNKDLQSAEVTVRTSKDNGPTGEVSDLASGYERVVAQNRGLREAVSRLEADVQFNHLQLRQVQEELEHWYCKYLDLQAAVEPISKKQ